MRTPWDDPYAILGLPKTATAREIQRAFRKIALRDHPDRNPGDERASERFKRASAAYQRLKDAGWSIPAPGEPSRAQAAPSPPDEAVSDEWEPLPEKYPDGSPIHYPTPEDIAAVVEAAKRPSVSSRWWFGGPALAVGLLLFIILDWAMGSSQTVKGRVVSTHYGHANGATVETTEIWTELGVFRMGPSYENADLLITTGWITGHRYAEFAPVPPPRPRAPPR